MCLDSRGSDSYFILYVNKDGAATGAGQARHHRAGEHNITLLLFRTRVLYHVAKIFFVQKTFENCRKYLLLLADCWLV